MYFKSLKITNPTGEILNNKMKKHIGGALKIHRLVCEADLNMDIS
jgi:hypothetical protein